MRNGARIDSDGRDAQMGIDAGTPGQMETKWMVEMGETGEGTNKFQSETGAHV